MDRIMGQRFAQRGNSPAWHCKGLQVGNQKMTAQQMLGLIGSYEVRLFPMFTEISTLAQQKYVPTKYAQIWRLPTKEDPEFRPFGEPVSTDYELIGPAQAAQIWDRALSQESGQIVPTETMGILEDGRTMFISAELPSFDVMGDEVKLYLFFYSPMYSNTAAVVAKTAVRTVCWNTLTLGLKQAVSKMILPHTPGAKVKIQGWIRSMYESSERTRTEAKADFTRMAKCSIRSQGASELLKLVYPDPPTPSRDWSFGISYDEHIKHFEAKMEKVRRTRNFIMDLFGGEGLGQDVPATEGTTYGLFNVISEYEDNRISSSNESRALSVTVGERAHTIRSAYNHCIKYAESKC